MAASYHCKWYGLILLVFVLVLSFFTIRKRVSYTLKEALHSSTRNIAFLFISTQSLIPFEKEWNEFFVSNGTNSCFTTYASLYDDMRLSDGSFLRRGHIDRMNQSSSAAAATCSDEHTVLILKNLLSVALQNPNNGLFVYIPLDSRPLVPFEQWKALFALEKSLTNACSAHENRPYFIIQRYHAALFIEEDNITAVNKPVGEYLSALLAKNHLGHQTTCSDCFTEVSTKKGARATISTEEMCCNISEICHFIAIDELSSRKPCNKPFHIPDNTTLRLNKNSLVWIIKNNRRQIIPTDALYTSDAHFGMAARIISAEALLSIPIGQPLFVHRPVPALPKGSSDVSKRKKIAFLFLTRGPMPLEAVWREFFDWGDNEGLYSIYIHPSESNYTYSNSSIFHNKIIPKHISVERFSITMVLATRYLLEAALEDTENEYFCLVSEACIPIVPFPKWYRIMTNDPRSIVNAHRGDEFRMFLPQRYREELNQVGFPKSSWRKGSQWFALNRKHALLAVEDQFVLTGFSGVRGVDEHYFPSLLAHYGLENETTCADGFAYTNWAKHNQSHPLSYHADEINFFMMRSIQNYSGPGGAMCSGLSSLCHFTARKFEADTLDPLLSHLNWILDDAEKGINYTKHL